jgi:hypothetical protein
MNAGDPHADRLWIPDNPDGSGWADVDWVSAAQGSRYHYRHVGSVAEERSLLPQFYRVVTRLESATLHPHENSYYISHHRLADFLAELSLAGGAETIWHVEPCLTPPPESKASASPKPEQDLQSRRKKSPSPSAEGEGLG